MTTIQLEVAPHDALRRGLTLVAIECAGVMLSVFVIGALMTRGTLPEHIEPFLSLARMMADVVWLSFVPGMICLGSLRFQRLPAILRALFFGAGLGMLLIPALLCLLALLCWVWMQVWMVFEPSQILSVLLSAVIVGFALKRAFTADFSKIQEFAFISRKM